MNNFISQFTGNSVDNLLSIADKYFNVESNVIGTNGNLNDFTTDGTYISYDSAMTASITNKPANLVGSFTLVVFRMGWITVPGQILVSADDSGIWYRKRVANNWTSWHNINYQNENWLHKGTTADRPNLTPASDGRKNHQEGFFYFDTTLNKPIWWNGDSWVDATGQSV